MRKIGIILFLVAFSFPAHADMAGSADHPGIPRVAGAEIYGYARSDYDAATMLAEAKPGKLEVRSPEGVRTRILYVAKPGDTPTMVMRNYAVALDELGAVNEIYSCRNNCRNHTFSSTLWTREAMIPTEGLKAPFYLLAFSHGYGSAHYRYAEVVTDESKFHVGVFSAVIKDNNSNSGVRQRTVALVEILEIRNFVPTLEFVDASQMQTEITQTGHVALYGIQFDTNQATLKPESQSTLKEITKALNANPGLRLYVVGHTDDVGALDYNNDLSLRRAKSVVKALVDAGIPRNRLTPAGVGPVAPIGSNDDEKGRAQNRRVELVKQSNAK